MAFKLSDLLPFVNVEDLDLAGGGAYGHFVILAEGHGADVVVSCAGLVDLGDLGRVARPHIQGGVQGHCNLVILGPIEQVQVEIVLQVGRVQDLVGLLADFPGLVLRCVLLAQGLGILFVCLGGLLYLGALAKVHYLVGKVGISGLQDVLLQQLLVAGLGGLGLEQLALHLESTRPDLRGDEAVSKRLQARVFLIFFHVKFSQILLLNLKSLLSFKFLIKQSQNGQIGSVQQIANPIADLFQLLLADSSRQPRLLQRIDDILGTNVSYWLHRVRAASKPADGRIDRPAAQDRSREDIFDGSVESVVEVNCQLIDWKLLQTLEQFLDLFGCSSAHCIPQGDFVAAQIEQFASNLCNFIGVDFAFVGASHHHRDIPPHSNVVFLGQLNNRLESFQGLFDGAVEVFLGKGLGGGGEDGNLLDSDFESSLHSFGVGDEARVGHSLQLLNLHEQLFGAGHLGHPFGRHERAYFHCPEPARGEHVDKLNLIFQLDDLLLVLQAIARPHLHNLDELALVLLKLFCILNKVKPTFRAICVILQSLAALSIAWRLTKYNQLALFRGQVLEKIHTPKNQPYARIRYHQHD